jgi:serine/threonine protein kinase
VRIGGRYEVGRKVGGGAFGEIFVCRDEKTGEEVAVKLEKREGKHQQLEYEARVMKALEGERGVPRVRWSGGEGSYNVMVMDLLGPSLEDLLTYCGRRFTLKTTLMLADQLLHRVECVHARGFVHRDIKPDNFLIGTRGEANTVHVIDFGLAKRYRNKDTMAHIVYRDGKHLTGTPRYASVNNHLGIEQSRRDDMESMGYVLVYFMKGILPWQGLRAESKKVKYRKIMEKKVATTFADLCHGIPQEFRTFFEHVRTLRFDQRPNYAGMRKMFRDLFFASGFENDGLFDWTIRKRCEMMARDQTKVTTQ